MTHRMGVGENSSLRVHRSILKVQGYVEPMREELMAWRVIGVSNTWNTRLMDPESSKDQIQMISKLEGLANFETVDMNADAATEHAYSLTLGIFSMLHYFVDKYNPVIICKFYITSQNLYKYEVTVALKKHFTSF